MTALLSRILILFAAIWFVRWFLKLLFGNRQPGRQTGASDRTKSPGGNMVKDPVCGMYMDPRLALIHETGNGVFYFCSEECKKKFLDSASGGNPDAPAS